MRKVRKVRHDHSKGSQRDYDGREGNRREPYDDPEEHLEIERRRFRGGLLPTPELYARAREQWYRLPGALVRPSMDTNVGDTDAGDREPER
jgi:hypothetical protein